MPTAAARLPQQAEERSLETLLRECSELWRTTPASLPTLGPQVSWLRQWRNARSTRRLVDEVAAQILAYPSEAGAQHAWRESLRGRILKVAGAQFGWPPEYSRLAFGDAFYDTAAAFVRQARTFDPSLSLEDLGQALRNVWIGNTLQILSERPVRLTRGLFAYSMLYPLTDNVLDAVDRTRAAKRAFNERLGAWLAGSPVEPEDAAERRVWQLVQEIDREWPRARHPDVWASVTAIHRAQVESVRQQHGHLLSDAALLALTIAKGGASVLADYRLISGGGDEAGARFAFAYGVFLQMLDDLQDVEPDLAAGHETLFTRAAREGRLDGLTEQLARFVERVLDHGAPSMPRGSAGCLDVIRRNCLALIVGVIARHPHRFGAGLQRAVERQWPLTLRATRRVLRHASRRADDTRQQLYSRRGVASPLELLLETGERRRGWSA